MCVVSMVGDHYNEKWQQRPYLQPLLGSAVIALPSVVSRAEFEQLKAEVAELKALLQRAKDYDEKNGEPDCEIEGKMALLRKVAAAVGIDLDDVLGAKKP